MLPNCEIFATSGKEMVTSSIAGKPQPNRREHFRFVILSEVAGRVSGAKDLGYEKLA
jgi:hypothetical protein